jgi:hypothetical protein
MLGVAYFAIQQYQQAVDAFLDTIRMDPTVEQPYVFIARSMDHTPSRMPEILDSRLWPKGRRTITSADISVAKPYWHKARMNKQPHSYPNPSL